MVLHMTNYQLRNGFSFPNKSITQWERQRPGDCAVAGALFLLPHKGKGTLCVGLIEHKKQGQVIPPTSTSRISPYPGTRPNAVQAETSPAARAHVTVQTAENQWSRPLDALHSWLWKNCSMHRWKCDVNTAILSPSVHVNVPLLCFNFYINKFFCIKKSFTVILSPLQILIIVNRPGFLVEPSIICISVVMGTAERYDNA